MVVAIRCMRYFFYLLLNFSHAILGTWFTYAVMQIFFGGFSGLEKPAGLDNRRVQPRVI